MKKNNLLQPLESTPRSFSHKHIGPHIDDIQSMLKTLNCSSLEELMDRAVPEAIRSSQIQSSVRSQASDAPCGLSENEALTRLQTQSQKNKIYRNFLGQGYYGTFMPPMVQRHVLENPGWYTAYTPYQAEIAQGRLEALLNFQTMICELTGMPLANASLLDEATAAAEAMNVCWNAASGSSKKDKAKNIFIISDDIFEQTKAVVRTRARPLGIDVVEIDTHDLTSLQKHSSQAFGLLVSYPGASGRIDDQRSLIEYAHSQNIRCIVAADLLSLTLLQPPGEFGADLVIGTTQRFGLPMGFGGPHAGYLAAQEEFRRSIPGRIVGLSVDTKGRPALRLALQTREQHIRREKATSNICTAQVLPAVLSSFYALYHGPQGLREIGERVHRLAQSFAENFAGCSGVKLTTSQFFDTVELEFESKVTVDLILQNALKAEINIARPKSNRLRFSFDETHCAQDVSDLIKLFSSVVHLSNQNNQSSSTTSTQQSKFIPQSLLRTNEVLKSQIFKKYTSETDLMRYMTYLQSKDLSLIHSMIPLGSCTMKLNAAVEMQSLSQPAWNQLHPFVPSEQAQGYAQLIQEVESWLCDLTGFAAVSLQPNAGSQGEYAGLLAIYRYYQSRGEHQRRVCLIPSSAHGTNPASAAMAGLQVVAVKSDDQGRIDHADLELKAKTHAHELAALMITYPSTHGTFEEGIEKLCAIIHQYGGQVYMDGANFNALTGFVRPAEFGVDVSHLNLHKTFCIPHGGGGPGIGPIGVAAHLRPFLPDRENPIAAAPWGSASLLSIPWAYLNLMGIQGLKLATSVAILSANYIAQRLAPHFPILYRGRNNLVAHECIIDLRPLKAESGVEVEDVAKRLMDFGFHAPTMSWPVPGTLMIEPTESESKAELDRFCDAMIAIREEIQSIQEGKMDRKINPLKMAPHTVHDVLSSSWDRPYSREQAAFPRAWVQERKFWPSVSRVDNAYGDRHLICSCPSVQEMAGS